MVGGSTSWNRKGLGPAGLSRTFRISPGSPIYTQRVYVLSSQRTFAPRLRSSPLFLRVSPQSAGEERTLPAWPRPRSGCATGGMSFSRSVKLAAYKRSGGRCECRRRACGHAERCPTILGPDHGECRHIFPKEWGGADVLANCEQLCPSCYGRAVGGHSGRRKSDPGRERRFDQRSGR